MFPRLSYIEWFREQFGTVAHDLGSSDLGPEFEGVVPPRIAELSDPDDDATLESRIADLYGPSVDPANVLVTAGATQANLIAAATALGAWGDRVAVESPGYEPLVATPRGLGAGIDRVPRDPPRYELDPAAVADAIDERTGLVTVTNRHNPSGRPTPRERLDAVASVVADSGARLLVDEVYAPFGTDPGTGPGTALGGPTAAGLDCAMATNSLTKFLGFDALRTGWLVGPEDAVDRARTVEPHLLGPGEVNRRLAARVLANRETLTEWSRRRLDENGALLASFVEERDGLEGVAFPGSTFGFFAHRTASGDEVTRAALDAGVLVVPGRFFGRPERFRISLGGAPERMRDGLDALGTVLDSLPAGTGDDSSSS